MKKKLIIFLVVLIVISLSTLFVLADKFLDTDFQKIIDAAQKANSDEKTVVAIVEGKKIYQETIDFLAVGEEIALTNSTSEIDDEDFTASVDKEKILEKQIRDTVVFAEAKRKGLEASDDEARRYTLENYEMIKEFDPDGYQFLLNYMEEMNITEEEYLELLTECNKKMLTRANLYDEFAKDKSGSYEEKVALYEIYVEELISKADIEYK